MHRCVALLYCIFFIKRTAAAQSSNTVTLMDFVKIKPGKTAEAMFFYENNWKPYRDFALKKKVIHSYEILKAQPDSVNNFDLILITVYKDSAQHAKSEENFRSILIELRPNGPVLLNDVKPADFRQNIFARVVQPLYTSSIKKKRK
jgi:hypothetical protein